MEYQLREGGAHDALDNLWSVLCRLAVMDYKSKLGMTSKIQTRTQNERAIVAEEKHRWMKEYRELRVMLLGLGMNNSDDTFKVLDDNDCWRPDIQEPVNFRQSKKLPGWIWTVNRYCSTSKNENEEDWLSEGIHFIWLKTNSH